MWGSGVALGLAAVAVPLLMHGPAREFPAGGLAQLALQLLLPLAIGPAVGQAVRRRGWAAVREGWHWRPW